MRPLVAAPCQAEQMQGALQTSRKMNEQKSRKINEQQPVESSSDAVQRSVLPACTWSVARKMVGFLVRQS
jgi:hypothetical protein